MNYKKTDKGNIKIWSILSILSLLSIISVRIWIYKNFLSGYLAYLFSDNAVYAIMSKRFFEGNFSAIFHPYWNMGFPLATVPFYLISGRWETAQILVSMFSIIVLLLVSFWFYKRFSTILAISIVFITAFSAGLFKLVISEGITEPLYIFLLWSGIFLGWLSIKTRSIKSFILTSFFLSLAYLVRTEAAIVISIYFMLTFVAAVFDFSINGKVQKVLYFTSRILIFLMIFLFINGPYIYKISQMLGKPSISAKYSIIGSGPYYALEKDRPSTWAQEVFSLDYPDFKSPYYNSERAQRLMYRYFENGTITQTAEKSIKESLVLYRSENTDNFYVGLGFYFTILGIIPGIILKKFRGLTLYFLMIFSIESIWISTFMAPHYRYLTFAFPFFFYLQGLFFYFFYLLVVNIISSFIKNYKIADIVGGFLIVIFLINYFSQNVDISFLFKVQETKRFEDHKILGDWIKSKDIKVLGGRMEAISFYSDSKLVYMPSETPEQIVEYMKKWGVEYLLVRPFEVGYEHVRPISDPNYKNKNAVLYHKFDEGSLIWRIKLSEKEKINNRRTYLENR